MTNPPVPEFEESYAWGARHHEPRVVGEGVLRSPDCVSSRGSRSFRSRAGALPINRKFPARVARNPGPERNSPPPALEHRPQEVTSKASTTIQAQQPDGFQVPVILIVRV